MPEENEVTSLENIDAEDYSTQPLEPAEEEAPARKIAPIQMDVYLSATSNIPISCYVFYTVTSASDPSLDRASLIYENTYLDAVRDARGRWVLTEASHDLLIYPQRGL